MISMETEGRVRGCQAWLVLNVYFIKLNKSSQRPGAADNSDGN